MKIHLTGILSGIVMFIWISIIHMALPLGEAGVREIPTESAVLGTMQSNIGDKTGLYILPASDPVQLLIERANFSEQHLGDRMASKRGN
jgi:hypothetical protein